MREGNSSLGLVIASDLLRDRRAEDAEGLVRLRLDRDEVDREFFPVTNLVRQFVGLDDLCGGMLVLQPLEGFEVSVRVRSEERGTNLLRKPPSFSHSVPR